MDAAWGSLSVETHCVLRDALKRTINSMTGQVSNEESHAHTVLM